MNKRIPIEMANLVDLSSPALQQAQLAHSINEMVDDLDDVEFGYLHDGVFYLDNAYTKPVTPKEKMLYVDRASRTLYLWQNGYIPITGGGSGEDKNFVFVQNTPSAEWVIDHILAKYPSVTVVDTAGSEVEGEVQYISESKLKIIFSAEFAGKAYLN